MNKYKFEEEVVEETVEETTTEESTPDSHETFVNILVEMGLSAEQAEAVHQMAMDLIDASEGEITEEVSIELRKQLREFGEQPATRPLRNAPYTDATEDSPSPSNMGKATMQALNMINKNLQK